jgi:hypothetical protein
MGIFKIAIHENSVKLLVGLYCDEDQVMPTSTLRTLTGNIGIETLYKWVRLPAINADGVETKVPLISFIVFCLNPQLINPLITNVARLRALGCALQHALLVSPQEVPTQLIWTRVPDALRQSTDYQRFHNVRSFVYSLPTSNDAATVVILSNPCKRQRSRYSPIIRPRKKQIRMHLEDHIHRSPLNQFDIRVQNNAVATTVRRDESTAYVIPRAETDALKSCIRPTSMSVFKFAIPKTPTMSKLPKNVDSSICNRRQCMPSPIDSHGLATIACEPKSGAIKTDANLLRRANKSLRCSLPLSDATCNSFSSPPRPYRRRSDW